MTSPQSSAWHTATLLGAVQAELKIVSRQLENKAVIDEDIRKSISAVEKSLVVAMVEVEAAGKARDVRISQTEKRLMRVERRVFGDSSDSLPALPAGVPDKRAGKVAALIGSLLAAFAAIAAALKGNS